MKRMLLMAGLFIACAQGFAQQQVGTGKQFMLIVRYRSDAPAADAELIKTNGQDWGEFIGDLAKSGKLITGLRPQQAGRTISGREKTLQEGPYAGDKAVISSFFVVKARSLDEATDIARKCPIYEFGGSVEVREVMNTAN